jgi:tetratricopeptide (TPR) repeat protein
LYSEKEKARLRQQYAKQAIALAMQGQWEEAVTVNKALLELFPSDVEAYNRLGRALIELGKYAQAKGAYSQALELDPLNSIAKKNLERLSHIGELPLGPKDDHRKFALNLFIKEAGKTVVANLEQPAPKEVLARMAAGEQVYLQAKGHRLFVQNQRGEYLGEVEPRYGLRLVKLIEGGNRYVAAISSLGENEAKVIIREVYQHPSQAGRSSFLPEGMEGFQPYIKKGLLEYELEEEFTAEGEEFADEEKEDSLAEAGFHEIPSEEEPSLREENGDWDS